MSQMKFTARTWLLICAAGLVVVTNGAAADPTDSGTDRNSIEGTWLAKVTTPNPPPGLPPSFLSMATFIGSGEAIEENNTNQIRSVAQGEWVRTGPRQFVRTMTYFGFAPGRTFVQFTRVTSSIELAHNGATYTATNAFEIYDTTGVLVATGHNTAVAKRCGLGDSVPNCIPS
jgi:hypothetical protein